MDEWINNPQWWISNTVAAIIALLLPQLFRRCRALFQNAALKTHGVLNRWFRNRRCKRLKKVKSVRFDSVAISRQIALSYAFLILFSVTAIATMAGFVLVPYDIRPLEHQSLLLTTVTFLPTIFFEAAWLTVAFRVDDILRHRKLIKPQRLGLR